MSASSSGRLMNSDGYVNIDLLESHLSVAHDGDFHEPSRLSVGDKIELAVISGTQIALQSLNTHLFLKSKDLFKDSDFYFWATLSGLVGVSSVVMIAMFYKLAPYLTRTQYLHRQIKSLDVAIIRAEDNAAQMEQSLQLIDDYFTELCRLTSDSLFVISNIPKAKPFKHHSNHRYFVFVEQCFYFLTNAGIGLLAGLNFDDSASLTSDSYYYYIAPGILALANAGINQYFFRAIEGGKLFLPSSLLLSQALDKTAYRRKEVDKLQKLRIRNHAQIDALNELLISLSGVIDNENESTLPKPPQIVLNCPPPAGPLQLLNHSADDTGANTNLCANFTMALLGFFPLMISTISAVILAVNAEETDRNKYYLPIALLTVTQLFAIAWRTRKYHHDHNITILRKFTAHHHEVKKRIVVLENKIIRNERKLSLFIDRSQKYLNVHFFKSKAELNQHNPNINAITVYLLKQKDNPNLRKLKNKMIIAGFELGKKGYEAYFKKHPADIAQVAALMYETPQISGGLGSLSRTN